MSQTYGMEYVLPDADKAVAKAWMELLSPFLGQLIHKAVLDALRHHGGEQAVKITGSNNIDFDQLVKQSDGILSRPMDGRSQPKATRVGKPTQEEHLALVGEFDGDKWAEMFIRTAPPIDKDTMLAWFAGSIMAGYDHAKKEYRAKHKSMGDCLDIQGQQGNWDANEYMFGMFNGMEHMMAIMEERDPQFRSWPKDRKTAEVDGEREVWAQAYAGLFMQVWDSTPETDNSMGARHERASAAADEAVKAFRERYK